jgi:hypothetical protein
MTIYKICSICKQSKDIIEFGKDTRCKQCNRNRAIERRNKYKEQKQCQLCGTTLENTHRTICNLCNNKQKEYRNNTKNKIKAKQYRTKYYCDHRDTILAQSMSYRSRADVKIKRNTAERHKKQNNIGYRLICYLRSRNSDILKNISKPIHAKDGIGCSIDELKRHIEKQFLPGMTWDNWGNGDGKWNIDHIKPFCLCNKNNIEEILNNNHYTNLRPMWWKENISRKYK